MISTARSTSESPGSMTAVMRAAPRSTGPRVLRAALVREGRVVDERALPPGAHLSVGASERHTFVVTHPAAAAGVRLIEHTSRGYRLRGARGVEGRVATAAGIVDLDAASALDLDDGARGKLVIGDAVVLFHFVEPRQPPPRAALPLGVRQGAVDLDWKTTFIAAFSFLFHFAAVGTIYSDWGDPILDDEARIAQSVQILKELPAPPLVEHPARPSDEASAAKAADAPAAKPASNAGGTRAPGPSRGGPGSGGGERVGDQRAHEIADALRSMNDAMILAIGARTGGATDRVLRAGNDAPLGMLEKVAAGPGGARPGEIAGLNLRGDGGGALKPGQVSRGGAPGADKQADSRDGEVGKQVAVKKPVGRADISPPSINGRIPDAGAVVGGMRGPLRACYRKALDEDPSMRGSVRVTASIAPNGEVKSTQAANSGLSSSMVACVTRVVRGAQFGAPEGGGATLVIPMSFIPQ